MTGPSNRFDDPSNEELDELLAALALDAVDDAERAELEHLLDGGSVDADRVRQAADRYARVVDWLATAVEPVEPPSGLWDQIASQLDGLVAVPEEPQLAATTPIPAASSTSPPPTDELAARRARRSGWTPLTTLVSVAAAIVLVIVIAAATLVVGRGGSSDTQDLASAAQEATTQPGSRVADLAPTEDGAGMSARVVVAADGQTYFVGDGLPALPDDQAYQLWSVTDDGEAISVGVLGSDPNVTMLSMGSDPGLLAVTIEPAVGSITATTKPIVAGQLA